jgi:uncharacterized protein (TIGR02453 family)
MPQYFTPALFTFLKGVKRHNNREWFLRHKEEYEQHVRQPALRFIEDFGFQLQRFAPRFAAIPKSQGGSLFRIYRDTRFSADKRPYKTHVGMYFPHKQAGPDVHAPCYYLHLEPGECFAGGGLWHPDTPALRAVRNAIVDWPDTWRRVRRARILEHTRTLVAAPRGYDPAHPFIDDLKRKDFVGSVDLTEARVCSDDVMEEVAGICRRMRPLMEFLTEALGLPF